MRHRPRVVYRGRDWETRKGIALRPEIASKLIWDPGDRERIIAACEAGDFRPLAFFLSALASDDTVQATMGHLCSLLRLPIQWTGDPLLIKTLKGSDPVFDAQTHLELDPGHPADFWRMHPYPELRRVLWDGRLGGLGLGEYVPQPEGPPRLQHLDLHGLRWEWSTELLSYHSLGEIYTVIPGDRRWLAFTPYGKRRWWDVAPWKACALPYISKQGARLDRLRRQGDLANALHVVLAKPDRRGAELDELERLVADDWELDGYLVLQEGEDAKLVESGGAGFEIFRDGEESADKAIAKALSGQTVTSTGTTGLNNAGGIWDNIAREIIEGIGETLADALHDQALKPYGRARGRSGLVWVHWDVRSPAAKVAEAEAAAKVAEALGKINAAVKEYGTRVDLQAFREGHGVELPLERLATATAAAWEETKHPRAKNGQFGEKNGPSSTKTRPTARRPERRKSHTPDVDQRNDQRFDAPREALHPAHRQRMRAAWAFDYEEAQRFESMLDDLAKDAAPTVGAVLDHYPVAVTLGRHTDEPRETGGRYYPPAHGHAGVIWISNALQDPEGPGLARIDGRHKVITNDWARTYREKTAAIFAHEVGHHFHEQVSQETRATIREAWERARATPSMAPSEYALTNEHEWFAEAFTLYAYAPEVLRDKDPSGFKVIDQLLKQHEGRRSYARRNLEF